MPARPRTPGLVRAVLPLGLVSAIGLGTAACQSSAASQPSAVPSTSTTAAATRDVTVTHGAVTPTSTLPGPSGGAVGTTRTFHTTVAFQGGTGTLDAIMTTTAADAPTAGLEVRITMLDFTFASAADHILIEGSASYPSAGSTLQVDATTVRTIIGGSGVYAGARGWAESTHLADGTWRHVFHLLP